MRRVLRNDHCLCSVRLWGVVQPLLSGLSPPEQKGCGRGICRAKFVSELFFLNSVAGTLMPNQVNLSLAWLYVRAEMSVVLPLPGKTLYLSGDRPLCPGFFRGWAVVCQCLGWIDLVLLRYLRASRHWIYVHKAVACVSCPLLCCDSRHHKRDLESQICLTALCYEVLAIWITLWHSEAWRILLVVFSLLAEQWIHDFRKRCIYLMLALWSFIPLWLSYLDQ